MFSSFFELFIDEPTTDDDSDSIWTTSWDCSARDAMNWWNTPIVCCCISQIIKYCFRSSAIVDWSDWIESDKLRVDSKLLSRIDDTSLDFLPRWRLWRRYKRSSRLCWKLGCLKPWDDFEHFLKPYRFNCEVSAKFQNANLSDETRKIIVFKVDGKYFLWEFILFDNLKRNPVTIPSNQLAMLSTGQYLETLRWIFSVSLQKIV